MAKSHLKGGRTGVSLFQPGPRRQKLVAVLMLMVLVGCFLAVYFVLPRELPWLMQRTLGLAFAALVAFSLRQVWLAVEASGGSIHPRRMTQHSDFGKELRVVKPTRRTMVRLPVIGETAFSTLASAVVFLATAIWWFTPWAPVRAGKPVVGDLTVPMGEEIAAAVLLLADRNAAVIAPPTVPVSVRQAVKSIRDDAPPYQLALRAIAQEKYVDARTILRTLSGEEAEKAQAQLAAAQLEMFACRFGDAVRLYRELTAKRSDEPLLLCQAAVAELQGGDTTRAESLMVRAVKLCQDKPQGDEVALAACLHIQAVVYLYRGKEFNEAVKLAQQSREMWQKALGDNDPRVGASANNQAVLFTLKADFSTAMDFIKYAHDVWLRTAPPQDAMLAVAPQNQGILAYASADYAQAEELTAEAVAIRKKTVGEEHPLFGLALSCQALVARALAKYDEAQSAGEQALAVCEKSLGGEQPLVAAVAGNLAATYADRARYVKAYESAMRAKSYNEKLWGEQHPFVAARLVRLAEIQICQARYDEAEARCQQAEKIASRAYGPKHPLLATTLATSGRLEIARGEPRKARPDLTQAKSILDQVFNKEHPELARTLGDLASLDNSPTSLTAGADGYKRALAMMEKYVGPEHPEVARLLCGLGVLDTQRDEFTAAAASFDRALAIQEKMLVPNHPDIAQTLEAYAAALEKMDPPQSARANEMLARAKLIREKQREDDHGDTAQGN